MLSIFVCYRRDVREIFISYAEVDGSTASGLAKELRGRQLSTWTYEEDGVPGISYLTQVSRAIESCRAFVLIASATSVKAPQVITEVEAAHEQQNMIITVRVELTHQEFTAANRTPRMANGTAVSSSVTEGGAGEVAKRIANALSVARQRAKH